MPGLVGSEMGIGDSTYPRHTHRDPFAMVRIRPELHPQAPGGPHREPNLAREDADLGISDFAETLARDLALLDVCDTARNESEIFGDGDKSFIRDARKRRQFRQNLCAYLNVSGKIASTEVFAILGGVFHRRFRHG